MDFPEERLLLDASRRKSAKLSLFFAIICMVDVFGVFPVITLPKAVLDCGFYGVLVIAVVCGIQMYTAMLLGKSWLLAEKIDAKIQDKKRYPYSALAQIAFGNICSNLVSVLVNLTIFCGGIPNLIFAAQNLELLVVRLSNDNVNISFCYCIIFIGMILCPVLWLGSPKDMKFLCSLSVAIVILVFLLITFCLIFTESNLENDTPIPELSLWELIFICYGIVSFQYDIHPSILTIQVDMKNKSSLNLAVLSSFGISLAMFFVVTVIAAIKFGTLAVPSILEILSVNPAVHVAAFLVALQLCLTLAVSNSALFQHLEDCLDIPREFNHRRCILRTTLCLLAILLAESVPRFDLVMSLIGGTLMGPLVFIFPPLFYLKLLSLERKIEKEIEFNAFVSHDHIAIVKEKSVWVTSCEIVACISIIIFTLVGTIITTIVNVKYALNYSNFTEPCIVNVTKALINL